MKFFTILFTLAVIDSCGGTYRPDSCYDLAVAVSSDTTAWHGWGDADWFYDVTINLTYGEANGPIGGTWIEADVYRFECRAPTRYITTPDYHLGPCGTGTSWIDILVEPETGFQMGWEQGCN